MAGQCIEGAEPAQKEPVKKCYLESIDFVLDKETNKTLTVYANDPSIDDTKTIYFLSDNKAGKEIQINALRKNKELCTSDVVHSQMLVKSNRGNLNSYISLSGPHNLQLIFDEFHKSGVEYFVFLPIIKRDKEYYTEKTLCFISCKQNKNVTIIVYPDVEYTATFEPKGKEKISSKKVEYEFTLEAKYGGSSFKFDQSIFTKIAKIFNKFYSLSDLVKSIFNSAVLEKGCIKLNVVLPSISFECDWKYVISEDYKQVGRSFEFNIKLAPLIGGEITIDILKFAAIAVGAVFGNALGVKIVSGFINFLEKVRVKLKKWVNIDLDLFVKIVFEGNINASLGVTINTVSPPENQIPLKGELEFKGKLKAGVTAKGKALGFKVEGSGGTGISLGGGVGYLFKEHDVQFTTEIKFKGVKINLVVEINVALFTLSYEPEWTLAEPSTLFKGSYSFSIDKKSSESSNIGDSAGGMCTADGHNLSGSAEAKPAGVLSTGAKSSGSSGGGGSLGNVSSGGSSTGNDPAKNIGKIDGMGLKGVGEY